MRLVETEPSPFQISVRGLEENDGDAQIVEGASAAEAFESALNHDVSHLVQPLLVWRGRKRLVALDHDRGMDSPVISADVPRYFPATLPQPLCAWATHDGGLRCIFVETKTANAMESAGAWMVCAPLERLRAWKTEVKTDTRHPAGARGDERCGAVWQFNPSGDLIVPGGRERAAATDDEINAWLETHGLVYGRHSCDRCPSCGLRPASCNDGFVVDEKGVCCFRCGYRASWDRLVGSLVRDGCSSLNDSAREFVHYRHQYFVLKDLRPTVPEGLLQPAWALILRAANLDRMDDPERTADVKERIDRAASIGIDVVRGASGLWLSADFLTERKVAAERTMVSLPWVRSRAMVDTALSTEPLKGFVPLQPINADFVVAPYAAAPSGVVVVRRLARQGDPPPVELGAGPPLPTALEAAWQAIEQRFIGINRGYLSGLLVAEFVAQRGIGTPPIVVATGRTGTGKSTTVIIAGSMVGAPARTVNLDDAGATLRQIGLHLEDGAGFLIADEAGRVPDFYHRMEPLLRINARVTFAAKYANERTVRMVAAIVVAGSSLPSAVVRSPELSRRAVGWRLLQDAPSWDRDIDVSDARKDEQLRQHLDVITCSIWWQVEAVQHRGEWRDFCFSRLGATPVDQLDVVNDTSGRDRAIRLLYEEYRSAGSLELSKIQGWKDWLIALPDSAAGELLSGLVDFDADEKKRMAECSDLSQLPINAILGFTSPPLTLSVKYRSSKWLVKFCELGVMRGRALKRGELPAAREPDARDCEGASEEGEKENEP